MSQDSIQRDRLLTSIDENLKNHLKNFDELHADFQKHRDEDKDLFKYVYMGIGGLAVLVFILERVWK